MVQNISHWHKKTWQVLTPGLPAKLKSIQLSRHASGRDCCYSCFHPIFILDGTSAYITGRLGAAFVTENQALGKDKMSLENHRLSWGRSRKFRKRGWD